MEDLNLPVFKEPLPGPRTLKMDDYLVFVELNLKYTVNISAARKEKKKMAVDAPFVLR